MPLAPITAAMPDYDFRFGSKLHDRLLPPPGEGEASRARTTIPADHPEAEPELILIR